MKISLKHELAILMMIFLVAMTTVIVAIFWLNSRSNQAATLVNIAGRQRMLSQKMTKEVLSILKEKEGNGAGIDYMEQLAGSVELFDRTLNTLTFGGETVSPDGREIILQPATDPELIELLKEGSRLWKEFNDNIKIVIKPETTTDSEDFKKALSFINMNNGQVMNSMNNITDYYYRKTEGITSLIKLSLVTAFTTTGIVVIAAFWLANLSIIIPLRDMAGNLKAIAGGDLTGELKVRNSGEIGDMAQTVNEMTKTLRRMIEDISSTSSNVASASDQVSSATEDLTAGAEIQSTSIERTSASIEEMNASIREIAENTSNLSLTAEEAASSTAEVAASINEVARISEDLSSTVEEVSSSISEMAVSVKEIAGHTSQLSNFTADTAAAVSQINTYVKEVEENLNHSAQLAESTTNDAEAGREAVRKTIEGMKRIKETVNDTATVIKSLGSRSEAIGEILHVINEVAEQTNLLALNAAIIAAQAGEHGKGFAVVADEIKDLAERTTASTREIEALIKAVQNEAANAVKSMELGGRSVETGFDLSQRAGEALDKILAGTNSSKEMVKLIARASQEQLKGSQQAKEAMDKITEMIKKVYLAIEDQEKGSAYIARAAEKMKDAASQVKKATNEQSQNGQLISKAIENISGMVNSINRGTQEQARGSQEIVKAMLEIKGIIEQNVDGLMKLSEVTEIMSSQTDILENAVKKFNV